MDKGYEQANKWLLNQWIHIEITRYFFILVSIQANNSLATPHIAKELRLPMVVNWVNPLFGKQLPNDLVSSTTKYVY